MISKSKHTTFVQYAAALIGVFIAMLIHLFLKPWLEPRLSYVLYLGAVIFGAAWGGLGPAVIVIIVGALSAHYLGHVPQDAGRLSAGFAVVSGIAAVLIDVAHKARRQSVRRADTPSVGQELLQTTLNSIGDGVIATDCEGTITLMNAVAQQLTGWSREEALGKPLRDVFRTVDDFQGVAAENTGAGTKITTLGVPAETTLIARSGAEIPIESSRAPVSGANDVIEGTVVIFRDVTLRRRADELRGQLAAIVDNSNDAIIGKDLNGRITSWNLGAEKLYGYSASEVIGRNISILCPPEYLSEQAGILERLRPNEGIGHYETVRIDKLGRRLAVALTISSILDNSGKVIGASIIARDVTHRQRADEEREQLLTREQAARAEAEIARERIRNILESIREGFFVLDRDFRYLYLNERVAAFARKPRDEILGRSVWDVLPELVGTRFELELRRTAFDHDPSHFEHWYAPGDEWLEVDCYPGEDGDLSVFVRDITARKKADQERLSLLHEIQNQRERIDNLIATVPGVVWEASGTPEMPFSRLNFVSNYVEKMLGYSVQEWLEKPNFWLGIVHPDDRDRTVHDLASTFAGGKCGSTQFRWLAKDGRTVWVEAQSIVVSSDVGKAIDMRGVCMDISERRQAEKEKEHLLRLEQELRAEAEAANRSKDEFLATVSHELRTPLNAMLGWARMLRSGKLERAIAARAVETIERNARSQAQLIDDLLDVSRIISGKLKLEVFLVELPPVIEAAVDSVRLAAQSKEITIELSLEPTAGPISGDPDRLQQIVWNLLSNAIKFTPRGGRVKVELERVDSSVQLRVSDTGKGIRREFLPYVFDRFRQADGTTARLQGGLGLGLAIVRHLVELHGGTVRATSPGEGQGAVFTVTLPIMSVRYPDYTPVESSFSESSSPNSEAKLQDWLDGIRVLVVDDEPDARELITLVLQKYGAETESASSAREALAKLERWRPDVLVADIGMPGEDGYALIRRVRALGPNRGGAIPALALTAYARVEDSTRALAAGFNMHVAKPVEPVELASVVAKLHSANAIERLSD